MRENKRILTTLYSLISLHKYQRVFLVFIFVSATLAASCTRRELNLRAKFEPSDAIWDAQRQCLWVVSDEGSLARVNVGGSVTYWDVDGYPDLEGVALIPERSKYVYLLAEEKAQLIEFDVQSGMSLRQFKLQGHNLEAVAWVQGKNSSSSALYTGGQVDGLVHVHKLDFKDGKANSIAQLRLPDPNPGDLSALHYDKTNEEEQLIALYDSSRLMVQYPQALALSLSFSISRFAFRSRSSFRVRVSSFELRITIVFDSSRYTRPIGASDLAWTFSKQWTMPNIGSEGIAWSNVNGTKNFYVCVDTSKSTVPKVKALYEYSAADVDECFKSSIVGSSLSSSLTLSILSCFLIFIALLAQ